MEINPLKMAYKTQRNVLKVISLFFCVFSKKQNGRHGNPMGGKFIKTNINHLQYISYNVVKYHFARFIRLGVRLDP